MRLVTLKNTMVAAILSGFLACCVFSDAIYAATNQEVSEQLESLRIQVQNNAAGVPAQIDYFQKRSL
jgi:two-component system sensor histidine kinase/response regulator